MTLMPSAPTIDQYGVAAPRPFFAALRETFTSFVVHFFLF